VVPVPATGEGSTTGLLAGVGSPRERNTDPISGEWSALAAESGARTELSVPSVVVAVGDEAGRITTRGVAEAAGEGEPSATAGLGSVVERSVLSCSTYRLVW
jgi:hypothetical protein